MTAFETWLKTPSAKAGLPPLVAIGFLIGGCGLGAKPQADTVPPPPPVPPEEVKPDTAPAPIAGLTPLPTPNQLLASLAIGREDPLASVAPPPAPPRNPAPGAPGSAAATGRQGASAATRPAPPKPLELPEDFRFTGVMRRGSTPQAFVQVGDQSGPVCKGEDGTCPASGLPSVLPPGWGVAAIDVDRGRLTLRKGNSTITTRL